MAVYYTKTNFYTAKNYFPKRFILILTSFWNLHVALYTQPKPAKCHRHVARCQLYRLVATSQQATTNLSISSSSNKSVKIKFSICRLAKTYWNNLIATSLWITTLDNLQQVCSQLETDLSWTSCHKPRERMLISPYANKLFQDVNRLVAT